MTYLDAMQIVLPIAALICGTAMAIWTRETNWLNAAMALVCGHGAIIAATNHQVTGSIGAFAACMGMIAVGAHYTKLLFPKPNRLERKQWRLLMGYDDTIIGLLRNDPRKGTWRK